jgi:hypothetical protein
MRALSRGLLRTEASMAGWPSSLELDGGGAGMPSPRLLLDFSSRTGTENWRRVTARSGGRLLEEMLVVGPAFDALDRPTHLN